VILGKELKVLLLRTLWAYTKSPLVVVKLENFRMAMGRKGWNLGLDAHPWISAPLSLAQVRHCHESRGGDEWLRTYVTNPPFRVGTRETWDNLKGTFSSWTLEVENPGRTPAKQSCLRSCGRRLTILPLHDTQL
jgi:hypothetical protein